MSKTDWVLCVLYLVGAIMWGFAVYFAEETIDKIFALLWFIFLKYEISKLLKEEKKNVSK